MKQKRYRSLAIGAFIVAAIIMPIIIVVYITPLPVAKVYAKQYYTSGGGDTFLLTWEPVAGAVSYNVYSSNDENMSNAALLKTHPADNENYVYSGYLTTVDYYYAIKTVSSFGIESAFSKPVQVDRMTFDEFLLIYNMYAPEVTEYTVEDLNNGEWRYTIYWNAVPGASSYKIYMVSGGAVYYGFEPGAELIGETTGTVFAFVSTKRTGQGFGPASITPEQGESPIRFLLSDYATVI